MAGQDAPRRLDSAHFIHLHVHYDDIGVQYAHHLQGVCAAFGFAYHFAHAISLEHRAGNASKYRLVVDK